MRHTSPLAHAFATVAPMQPDQRSAFADRLCAMVPKVRAELRKRGVGAGRTSSTAIRGYSPVSTEGVNLSCGDELERDAYWNKMIRTWMKQGMRYAEAQRRRSYPTRILADVLVRHPFGRNDVQAALAAQEREARFRTIVTAAMITVGLVPYQDGWTLPGGPPPDPRR